ncbi:MAG TPA: hypothetical protein VGY58_07030 [Gemmataceae bacterium]|jgi:hypothetical protein|nr:hypothetical protein [Gemmataceae bacterium]
MSTPTQATECPFCSKALPAGRQDCPHCKAPAESIEAVRALEFAQHRFVQWAKESAIHEHEAQALTEYYERQQAEIIKSGRVGKLPALHGLPAFNECWSCGVHAASPPPYCSDCGVPWDSPAVHSLRFMAFLCHEIKRHEEAGRLALAQAHNLLTVTRERMAALNNRLEKARAPAVVAAAPKAVPKPPAPEVRQPASPRTERPGQWADKYREETPAAEPAAEVKEKRPRLPRRALWEIMLDARNIQWLLMFGAFLLVVGLVIWLAALGVFEHKEVLATIMGVANVAVLAGGWATLRYTRYQTAGRALTLLACLVMPLNLWFYHANQLITLSGHLWIAALVCCVLYAASALTLRDPMFVYVLMGGVAMTALLLLGDQNIDRINQIVPPATLLVVLGLIGVHVERGFPPGEGPFSRKGFGLAFFWSGHALLGAGLLLVLGAQIAGWLYDPIFHGWGLTSKPELVMADSPLRLVALALVLAGAYAYLYSDIVVRRIGVYVYVAILVLLWAEVLVVKLLGVPVASEVIIIVLALTALAANLLQLMLTRANATLTRAGPPLGLFLSTIPVLLGILLHLRATNQAIHDVWPLDLGWSFVGAMAVTALSSRIGAYLYRHTMPWLSAVYFFGTAAATIVGAAGLLICLGVKAWDVQAPFLMLIPIAYVAASRMYRGHTAAEPLVWVGQAATGIMVLAVLAAAWHITPLVFEPVSGDKTNLLLGLFFAEAALFYALVAAFHKQGYNLYLAASMACGAIWQLLLFWSLEPETYTLVFATLGFLLLIAYRIGVLESFRATRLAKAAFQSANALMSLSFVAAALITLGKFTGLDEGKLKWPVVGLLITLTVISLLAAWLVREQNWRRWYVVAAIGEGLLAGIALNLLSELTRYQRLEIFSILIGVILLVVSHVGWYREQDRHSDMVSLGLFLGSVLAGLPLTIAVLSYRSHPAFHWQDELGMLAVGVLLLASGFMLQLRSTTLVGGCMLAIYLVTLLMFMAMIEAIKSAGVLLTFGGAVLFLAGLLLSVYRDRLLMLPDKIKRREGVFRVLAWR